MFIIDDGCASRKAALYVRLANLACALVGGQSCLCSFASAFVVSMLFTLGCASTKSMAQRSHSQKRELFRCFLSFPLCT